MPSDGESSDRPPAVRNHLRVRRTFAFVDLCGFTEFDDRYGDEAAMGTLSQLRSTVRDVAPRWGVRIDKWIGDGAMLVGVDSEPLVRAVIDMFVGLDERQTLAPRAGIATGEVILLEGDDYVGRVVNLADRLCNEAEAGQILAAENALAGTGLPTDGPAVMVRVKGFAEPVRAVSVVWRSDRVPGP